MRKIKINKIKKRFDVKNFIFSLVIGLILTVFVIITIYPILNTLAISFNEALDALRGGIYFLPRKWTLNNYRTVLHKESIRTGLYISVLRTLIGTVTHLATTAMLSFVLSRKKFIFAKPISFLYVLTMYVNGGLIPGFLLNRQLGLMNSFWVYILYTFKSNNR